MQEIRWQQRFENFQKAFGLLNEVLQKNELQDLEKEAAIQRFEMTYELAWKTIKDYLEFSGNIVRPPATVSNVMKTAFQVELIRDGQVWFDIIEWRNKTVHEYDINIIRGSFDQIKNRFVPAIKQVYEFLKTKYE